MGGLCRQDIGGHAIRLVLLAYAVAAFVLAGTTSAPSGPFTPRLFALAWLAAGIAFLLGAICPHNQRLRLITTVVGLGAIALRGFTLTGVWIEQGSFNSVSLLIPMTYLGVWAVSCVWILVYTPLVTKAERLV